MPASARSDSTKRARDVETLGRLLTPCRDLLSDTATAAPQLARTLDPPPCRLGLGALADALAAFLALVGRPLEATHRLEARHQFVVQGQEVLHVGGRVPRCSTRSGRRVQSVSRSPLVRRAPSSFSTVAASDGVPMPMNPAAT